MTPNYFSCCIALIKPLPKKPGPLNVLVVNGDLKLIHPNSDFAWRVPLFTWYLIGGVPLSVLNHTGLTLMLEPITFSSNRHNTRMVQEAIQQCSRQRGILGKGRIPLAKRQVAMVTISEPRS